MEPDVPLLMPEINPDHLKLIPQQQRMRGWKGQIVTNPNCSTIVLAMALAPLKQFGITRVIATTMQAISGAGYPGVRFHGHHRQRDSLHRRRRREDAAGDAEDPGRLSRRRASTAGRQVSAHCNRVPVVDGHTVTVSVEVRSQALARRSLAAIEDFRGIPQERNLPSAPP